MRKVISLIIITVKGLIEIAISEGIKRLGGEFLLNYLLIKVLISVLAEIAAGAIKVLTRIKPKRKR